MVRVGQLHSDRDIVGERGLFAALLETVAGAAEEIALVTPMGVAVDARGRVVVADPGLPGVVIFDTAACTTRLLRETDQGNLDTPVGVAIDDTGAIYVTDSVLAAVACFDAAGAFKRWLGVGLLQRPTGIAFDPATKRLLVVDTLTHTLVALDREGKPLATFGERGVAAGQFNYPLYIAVDGTSQSWVVDSLNGRVQRLDPQGRPRGSIGRVGDSAGSFARAKGIAVDDDGNLYVSDAVFDNVQVFDPRGRLLLVFGQPGSGDGDLLLPAGIAVDSQDHVFVADSSNHRVQIFQLVEGTAP